MKTGEDLYQFLEHKSDLGFVNLKYNEFDLNAQSAVAKEDWCFLPIESINPTGLINFDENVEYFTQRINKTSNIYLKIRYAHVLYLLTREGRWFEEATLYYRQLIEVSINSNIDAYETYKLLADYASLTLSVGKKHKQGLFYYLFDIIKSSKSAVLQNWVLHLLKSKELYVKEELEYIVNKCIAIYKDVDESSEKEFALKNGLFFARKEPAQFKEQLSLIYELFGDYERTLLWIEDGPTRKTEHAFYNDAHLTKMLDYYKKAGERAVEKYNATLCQHSENKKFIHFGNVQQRIRLPRKATEMILEHFDAVSKLSTERFIQYMCDGDTLVFSSWSKLSTECYDVVKKLGMTFVRYDINSNPVSLTKEQLDEESKKFLYDQIVANFLPRMIAEILDATKSRKITSKKLVKYLREKSFLGLPLQQRRDNEKVSYCWIDQIDYLIDELFKQSKIYLKDKDKADWRICTDGFALRFEGVLRDICRVANAYSSKYNPKDNSLSEILLEKLLEQVSIMQVFTDDDIVFFKYVLTNMKRNIRNDVAHSFYISTDYNIYTAYLTFLCVMRLAKVRFYFQQGTAI